MCTQGVSSSASLSAHNKIFVFSCLVLRFVSYILCVHGCFVMNPIKRRVFRFFGFLFSFFLHFALKNRPRCELNMKHENAKQIAIIFYVYAFFSCTLYTHTQLRAAKRNIKCSDARLFRRRGSVYLRHKTFSMCIKNVFVAFLARITSHLYLQKMFKRRKKRTVNKMSVVEKGKKRKENKS